MILNVNFFLNNFSLFLIFFYKLTNFNFSTSDIGYRLNFNDNFLNFYSFFWTNFWYLPIFFFITYVLLFFFWFNRYSNVYVSFALLFVCFYYLEIFNFYFGNQSFSFINSHLNSFNFFLLNNINKYHPLIFYLSVLGVFLQLNLLISLTTVDFFYFKKEYVVMKFASLTLLVLLLNVSALFLGSWWALQEGSWGGWWNWDASETLGLLVLLIALFFTHSSVSNARLIRVVYISFFKFLFVIFIYYFVQLNFDLVSHNFGIKFFYFFNNSLFLIESLYFFFFTCLYVFFRFYRIFYNLLVLKNKILFFKKWRVYKHYYFLCFFAIFLKTCLVSFSFLVNYFLWNFLLINTLNHEYTLNFFSVYFWLFIFGFLWKPNVRFVWIHFVFFFSPVFFFYTIFFASVFSLFSFSHCLLVNFFAMNIFFADTPLLDWEPSSLFSDFLSYDIFYRRNKNLVLDSYFAEHLSCGIFKFSPVYSWSTSNILHYFNFKEFFFALSNTFFYSTTATNSDIIFINSFYEILLLESLLFCSFAFILNVTAIYFKKLTFFK